MRPAAAIYDNFSEACIADELEPDPSRALFLAANATRSETTAVLCQYFGSQLRIYADWVAEGSAADTVANIHAEASLIGDGTLRPMTPRYDWHEALKLPIVNLTYVRRPPVWVVPPHHGDQWNNVGLEQAVRLLPAMVSHGVSAEKGRDRLRDALSRSGGYRSPVVISTGAQWTLRAFAGGYSRSVRRGGGLADYPEEGVYRTLMEGLEGFAGITGGLQEQEELGEQPLAFTRSGQAYRSAMPDRASRR